MTSYELDAAAQDALSLAARLHKIIAHRQGNKLLDARVELATAIEELQSIAFALGYEIRPSTEHPSQELAA